MSSFIAADVDSNAEIRFFCVPYAGAGASIYRSWAPLLPSSVQLCPVQLPGREERLGEPVLTDLSSVVSSLMESLPDYFDRPYVLFGHSMGAKIVFELCREIEKAGLRMPEILLVSACKAPHIPEPYPIHALPQPQFLEGLKRYSADTAVLTDHPELMELLLPSLRSDFLLDETYVFEGGHKKLPVPIEAFYGTDDAEATLEEVSAWSAYTKQFSLTAVKGGHLFLREKKQEFVEMLCSRIGGMFCAF
jgi:surfactin synthase thioesterase subunit